MAKFGAFCYAVVKTLRDRLTKETKSLFTSCIKVSSFFVMSLRSIKSWAQCTLNFVPIEGFLPMQTTSCSPMFRANVAPFTIQHLKANFLVTLLFSKSYIPCSMWKWLVISFSCIHLVVSDLLRASPTLGCTCSDFVRIPCSFLVLFSPLDGRTASEFHHRLFVFNCWGRRKPEGRLGSGDGPKPLGSSDVVGLVFEVRPLDHHRGVNCVCVVAGTSVVRTRRDHGWKNVRGSAAGSMVDGDRWSGDRSTSHLPPTTHET